MRTWWMGISAATVLSLSTTAAFADDEPEPARARFTTIQTDHTVNEAACRITAQVETSEGTRPIDVRFRDQRCSSAPAADDAIPLTVTVEARDARRDVVLELAPSPDLTAEDARNTVTRIGRTLRTLVVSTPIEVHVPDRPSRDPFESSSRHGMSGAGVAAIVIGSTTGLVLIGALFYALASGMSHAANSLGSFHFNYD